MAWTQADVTALESAISKGSVIQSMTVGSQTFTFRSLDEMRHLLADMKREAAASGESRTRYAATSKGLGS
jgi:hypothetical protein